MKIFLCGDVMTGRGIDQVLPSPCDPTLYERYVTDAREYVRLAEAKNGPIPRPVDFSYVWGEALNELDRLQPDLRIINLETSVTRSNSHWKGKGIHYRMSPENLQCIKAARIDHCSLANNHVLDWGYGGLAETLRSLKEAEIQNSGAGMSISEAETPTSMTVSDGFRVVVFSFGLESSGIPAEWAAKKDAPGVNLLPNLSGNAVNNIRKKVEDAKRENDVVVASIHWGQNWGYEIPAEQREFAHGLIDKAGVDVVYGHSSHHVKGIEIHQGKVIFYGCGDFLNDYEGIEGYENFRDDLSLMYFVSLDTSTGRLLTLEMIPTKIKRFRVCRASDPDALWLKELLNREGKPLGTTTELDRWSNLKLRETNLKI